MTVRRTLIWAHKWIGIGVGAIFAVTALSGAATVFHQEMAALAEPDLHRLQTAGAAKVDLAQIVSAAAESLDGSFQPDTIFFPLGEAFPDRLTAPVSVSFQRMGAGTDTTQALPYSLEIVVDPVTGQVLGTRTPGLLDLLVDIHVGTIAGPAGEVIVGLSALFLMLTLATGLIVWWPRPGGWRKAFQIRTGTTIKLLYGLHTAIGAAAAAFLLLSALTGVYLSFPDQTRSVVGRLATLNSPFPKPPKSVLQPGAAPIGPDRALAISRTVYPDGRASYIQLPTDAAGAYRIKLFRPGQPRADGETNVWLDQYSGVVLARRTPENFSAGELLLSYARPIHVGEAIGLPGRLLALATGLILLLSTVTGIWFWLAKPKPRRRGVA